MEVVFSLVQKPVHVETKRGFADFVNALNLEIMKILVDALKGFRDERDWAQFHNPKDLALAISIESNELLAEYLWKSPEEADIAKVKSELADVLSYCLLLADKYHFNVEEIILEKINVNREKYPVDKSKGNARKYTEF
jgi:NTP pyrophosphatase (non-canonical NTP hydrolase)